jgi:hypothetical protein
MMTATAVYPLSRNAAFTPEVTNAMGEAFDLACRALGQIPPHVKETIATRVIREASTGERDTNRLFTAALKGLSV